jgi:N-acetylglucosaminyldiphosphoundecaprenol N-acetyl-beta-D-mannosaminyltransferase
MKKIKMFGCTMDSISMEETVEKIVGRVRTRRFTQHVVVNVAKLVNMQSDARLAESVRACDIVNIDGQGVVWGARLLGHHVPERVAGCDLFDHLLRAAARNGFPVYLLGATEEVIDKTVKNCLASYPGLQVAGYHHGYFWNDEQGVVNEIKRSGARLLFVAITSPKKEIFIDRWKDALGVDFVMGVGGTFDVVAGKVKRAPRWMQSMGLEWFFRVVQEPGRMWRRYLVTNSRFAFMLGRAGLLRLAGVRDD